MAEWLVVARSACPSQPRITLTSTPASSRWTAVYRKVCGQGGQQPGCLLPERAGPPFAAFAVQAHQRVLAEVEVAGAQVGGLLGAGAGVVKEQDQGPVP